MNKYVKSIKIRLGLRDPQREALEVLHEICEVLSLDKECELDKELEKVSKLYPTLTSFERDFPSLTFALATGIGKTRLMGAMMTYLHHVYGINNFLLIAPNLTIYDKLKQDFGNPNSKKYVFSGVKEYVDTPKVIDGNAYNQIRFGSSGVIINIFNISKFTSDNKAVKEKGELRPARIKRLNENLGESYFEYLKGLDDLCIFMDESHHYHAEKSFEVINELKPILGVEVTATPQVQKGGKKAVPFKNVVYEYSLAHALNDEKYVKVPIVTTREDLKSEQFTQEEIDKEKLNDGIGLHITTQIQLDLYSRQYSKPLVKPFVLVITKDTEHSKKIKEYLTSDEFCRGKYKDKVLEIHSAQKGQEKDENIEKLLNLESPDNEIEIVIHVNMLKEGWDVSNLYTIIPLRTSASETLTEQTIGRGLRLPFGERTKVEAVDRLSIVSHEKYDEIVKLAENEDSLVRKVYQIDPNENPNGESKEVIELPTTFQETTTSSTYIDQLTLTIPTLENVEDTVEEETKISIAKTIAKVSAAAVQDISKQVKNINEVKEESRKEWLINAVVNETKRQHSDINITTEEIKACVEEAVKFSVQTLTDKVIPIPVGTVQAIVGVKIRYDKFKLDTTSIHYQPTDNILIATELKEGGRTYKIDIEYAEIKPTDSPEDAIAKFIIAKDNIDYVKARDVIYDVIDQLKTHLYSYLETEENVDRVLRERRKNLAETLYAQINDHFFMDSTSYEVTEMRPFSKIEVAFGEKFESDKIHQYTDTVEASELKSKIFTGFKKSCHSMYKFHSTTEKTFATVLENDNNVLRWLCPSIKQFNMYYDKSNSSKYQPDFIVETEDKIYMIETKDSRFLEDDIVQAKARSGTEYCKSATEYNLENGGKAWEYKLIPHDEVRLNSSFNGVITVNANVQITLDISN